MGSLTGSTWGWIHLIYLRSWPELISPAGRSQNTDSHSSVFYAKYILENFLQWTHMYQSKSWRWRQPHSGWLFIKWGDDTLSKCDGGHKSHKHNWINKKNLFYDDRHPIQWIKYARIKSFGFRKMVLVVFFLDRSVSRFKILDSRGLCYFLTFSSLASPHHHLLTSICCYSFSSYLEWDVWIFSSISPACVYSLTPWPRAWLVTIFFPRFSIFDCW